MTQTKEKTTRGKNQKVWIAAIAAVALIALFAVVYALFGPKAAQGSKHITVAVVDAQGAQTDYDVHTEAEFLREVLEQTEGLSVEGSESQYGLMIETVNGVTADYEADGAYWSVYVNGEYGNYGVDLQPVADGDEYTLKYTVD